MRLLFRVEILADYDMFPLLSVSVGGTAKMHLSWEDLWLVTMSMRILYSVLGIIDVSNSA